MAWRHVATAKLPSLFPPNPNPNSNPSSAAPAATAVADVLPFLNSKLQKKLRKKLQSPCVRSIQPDADRRLPHFEAIVLHDADLRFITHTKSFLADLHGHRLPLADAGKIHRKLRFPPASPPATPSSSTSPTSPTIPSPTSPSPPTWNPS